MKGKVIRVRGSEGEMSADEQVRTEIQSFLRALNSYPDRFAREPEITFEEHRNSLVQTIAVRPRRRG
jgi:hypothetical protein